MISLEQMFGISDFNRIIKELSEIERNIEEFIDYNFEMGTKATNLQACNTLIKVTEAKHALAEFSPKCMECNQFSEDEDGYHCDRDIDVFDYLWGHECEYFEERKE